MNYNEAKEYLKRYLKARIPVIVINSVEKNRSLRLLKEISEETNMPVHVAKNPLDCVVNGTGICLEKDFLGFNKKG